MYVGAVTTSKSNYQAVLERQSGFVLQDESIPPIHHASTMSTATPTSSFIITIKMYIYIYTHIRASPVGPEGRKDTPLTQQRDNYSSSS